MVADFWFPPRREERGELFRSNSARARASARRQPNIIEKAAVETASVTVTMMSARSFTKLSAISFISLLSPLALKLLSALAHCNAHADQARNRASGVSRPMLIT